MATATEARGRPSARRAAAGFLRRMMSSDDVSKKSNKAPVLARARSLHTNQPKDPKHKIRAVSSPRNSLSVDELLECPICIERFKRPKMLPCQHTFCLSCLEKQISTNGSKEANVVISIKDSTTVLFCPTCRAQVKLSPEKGLTSLPPNLYIESLLRVVRANGGTVHAALQRQHSASSIQTRPRAASSPRCMQCDTACEVRYCDHCQHSICNMCWPNHMTELKEQLSTIQYQLSSAQSRLQQRREDFKVRCNRLNEKISIVVEEKVRALRDKERQLTNETKRILTDHETSANQLQERMARQLLAAPGDESQFELADDDSKVSQFMKVHRNTSELLKAVGHWGESHLALDEDHLRIECIQASESTEEHGVTVESAVDGKLLEQDHVSADSVSLFYRSRNLQVPRLRLGRGSVMRPSGLNVAPWAAGTELYVAASDGHVVVVFDKRNGRQLRQLASSEPPNNMLCPTGVAFCGARGEVYVSDKWRHCIHVFARDGRYIRQLGFKGSTEGSFLAPEGIASDSEAGVLYVCDTCNDRIQVIRIEDGAFVGLLGVTANQATGNRTSGEFNQPTGIALGTDRIVVCDHGNRRIKVFLRSTGQKVLEFGSSGAARGQFRTPECVAVDKMGFILVGDSGNGRVQVFRPNGQMVMAFGRFSWVSGVHVTQNFEIFVSDSKGHCISVYN